MLLARMKGAIRHFDSRVDRNQPAAFDTTGETSGRSSARPQALVYRVARSLSCHHDA